MSVSLRVLVFLCFFFAFTMEELMKVLSLSIRVCTDQGENRQAPEDCVVNPDISVMAVRDALRGISGNRSPDGKYGLMARKAIINAFLRDSSSAEHHGER